MRYDKQNKKLYSLKERIKALQDQNEKISKESDNIKEVLRTTLHEVRLFSAQLSKFAERLSRELEGNTSIAQTAQSVFYTAGMISSRLAYTDIELNPNALENQTPIRSGIYRKFDKCRRILSEEARENKVNIKFSGESRIEIEALPVFELLPFVLLDNAIKYSPPNQEITVSFDNINNSHQVIIRSLGPCINSDDLSLIFNKGHRGRQTEKMPGQGLGLFLAKQVCSFHGISIEAQSEAASYNLNNIPYSEISILLTFKTH